MIGISSRVTTCRIIINISMSRFMMSFRTCDRRWIWDGIHHAKSSAPVVGFMAVANWPRRRLRRGQPQMNGARRLVSRHQFGGWSRGRGADAAPGPHLRSPPASICCRRSAPCAPPSNSPHARDQPRDDSLPASMS